jgi:hypothetical protein
MSKEILPRRRKGLRSIALHSGFFKSGVATPRPAVGRAVNVAWGGGVAGSWGRKHSRLIRLLELFDVLLKVLVLKLLYGAICSCR